MDLLHFEDVIFERISFDSVSNYESFGFLRSGDRYTGVTVYLMNTICVWMDQKNIDFPSQNNK